MWIAIAAAALLLLIVFLISPSKSCRRAESWRGTPFAHRGLHGEGVSENSAEAFEAACRRGFGIELDVQLSRDGEPVVFHDDTLARMTGDARRVDEVDLAGLRTLSLKDGGVIPTFAEVLSLVNGRVPLLVELKTGKHNAQLCALVLQQLESYSGRFLLESFNPLILRWFRHHAPHIIRGQLVGARAAYLVSQGPLKAWLLSSLCLNFLARPDFVAYDISAAPFCTPRVQRTLFRVPMAAWTVTDPETYKACIERGEMPIFQQIEFASAAPDPDHTAP